VTPTDTSTPVPQGIVEASDGLLLRVGPAKTYFKITTLKNKTLLTVIGRTADIGWLRVRFGGLEGWVDANFVQVTGNLSTVRIVTAEEIAQIPKIQNCVTIVGDSIAHGGVIFELPSVGYIEVQTAPFSTFIAEAYKRRGINTPAYDRSQAGIGISSPKHRSFFNLALYQSTLQDHCKVTVIMPWVNDLSSGRDAREAAPLHAAALSRLVHDLINNNPEGRILLVNYYPGAPAGFITAFAPGFNTKMIQAFNDQLSALCSTGLFSQLAEVSCIDANAIFAPMTNTYVVGPMTKDDMEKLIVSRLRPDQAKLVDAYTAEDAAKLLVSDGVHMSPAGKAALADYIVNLMLDDANRAR
jgi:hypothetical protein